MSDDLVTRLRANHPLQYGFSNVDGRAVMITPDTEAEVTERYSRCPKCEEWSPCDVRQAADRIEELEAVLWLARDDMAGWAQYADDYFAAIDAVINPTTQLGETT